MKKVTIAMFGVSVFAGLGYLAFANTSVGKNTLIKWLLKKWKSAAELKKAKVDFEYIKSELMKLSYKNLELLTHYTWVLPPKVNFEDGDNMGTKKAERLKKLYDKIKGKEILRKADLSKLKYIVFP